MADEKTTVVEAGGGGGNALAFILGAIVLLVVLYVVFGTNLLRTSTHNINADVKVESPSTK